jgi:hypothetical protein
MTGTLYLYFTIRIIFILLHAWAPHTSIFLASYFLRLIMLRAQLRLSTLFCGGRTRITGIDRPFNNVYH